MSPPKELKPAPAPSTSTPASSLPTHSITLLPRLPLALTFPSLHPHGPLRLTHLCNINPVPFHSRLLDSSVESRSCPCSCPCSNLGTFPSFSASLYIYLHPSIPPSLLSSIPPVLHPLRPRAPTPNFCIPPARAESPSRWRHRAVVLRRTRGAGGGEGAGEAEMARSSVLTPVGDSTSRQRRTGNLILPEQTNVAQSLDGRPVVWNGTWCPSASRQVSSVKCQPSRRPRTAVVIRQVRGTFPMKRAEARAAATF